MKRGVVFILCLSLLRPVMAALPMASSSTVDISTSPLEDEYAVYPSTPTKKQLRQMREFRPRKAPIRQLHNMERTINRAIKRTSPNPRVQSPGTSAMPGQAPAMPKPPAEVSTPPTRADRFLNAAAKVMTKSWNGNIFVWLPAISTDPNTGPTMGVLPVLVLADPETHHIRHLFAPSYTYNELFGHTGTWRYYFYPTDASQLFTTASYSQHTNREVKARYENTAARDGVLYIRAESYYAIDASNRFFGIGPQTREGDEAGYTSKDAIGRVAAGINFEHSWRATLGARLRQFSTASTIIPHTADLTTRQPDLAGIGTHNTMAGEFRLLWDTRDSPITPSHGSSGELFTETTSPELGSDSDYIRYGLDGKRFFLWKDPKQVTVLHGLYEWANGPFIPFYELPSLGGRDTLRGYGEGRFADRGRLVANVEHRYTFSSLNLMGIQTNFEIAPFFDIGSVFPTASQIERRYFRPVYGTAFRAAVKPNVVGDVEVGIGKEGPAVFVDINYPY